MWHTNDLLRKQFTDVLAVKHAIKPTVRPMLERPAASVVPLEQPLSQAPGLVTAPAIVHGQTPVEKAHTELQGILLGQVAAVKAEKKAVAQAEKDAYMEKPEAVRAADADHAQKVGRKAAEQALGIMPPSEIATLSLDDTAEIGALFEWAPSKVSELDPTLYQDSDKSDYAEWVTTAHPVSPHFKMLQNTSVGSVGYSSPPVPPRHKRQHFTHRLVSHFILMTSRLSTGGSK